MIKRFLYLILVILCSHSSKAQSILMFVSHEETYYSEYIVMREALESSGYSIDVRSANSQEFSIYMTPYSDIPNAANDLAGSSYSEFQGQFQELFGATWDEAHNTIPPYEMVSGSIMNVADITQYDGFVVVGGLGALDYRVDGVYQDQGEADRLVSAEDIGLVAEKLNELALLFLEEGKPVMAQCHGASIPAYWRIPDTSGPDEEELGFSLLKGGISTGFPEAETGPMLESLDITYRVADRISISSPHSAFEDDAAGEGRIITTRDWYPQTVAYAARAFLNVLNTYPSKNKRIAETTVLVLHGGELDDSNLPSSCSPANKENDIPCNNGVEIENLPADYTHLVQLLSSSGVRDDFDINPTPLDLSEQLPFSLDSEVEMLEYFEDYDVIIFFKHWSTFISDEMQSALLAYVDNGGGVMSLHHGLYNDVEEGQNKNILANQLFGAHSPQSGWSASLTTYDVHSTDHGHFISSYLIDYENANSDPVAWSVNTLPASANTAYSTTHNFSIYDELYNNMTFTGTIALGRDINEITPLFSNDQSTNSITHTTGFTRLVDIDGDGRVGKVVYLEIGERKENFELSSRFGQIVRNATIWMAPNDEQSESEPEPTLDLDNDFVINYYPNPVSSTLTLELKERATVSIVTLDGKYVFQKVLRNGKLNLAFINAGTYILKIQAKEGTIRRKIVKLKNND